MKIADGIEMLEIQTNMGPGLIHPTLLWDSDEAILVDAGFPHQLPLLREALAKSGTPLEKLR